MEMEKKENFNKLMIRLVDSSWCFFFILVFHFKYTVTIATELNDRRRRRRRRVLKRTRRKPIESSQSLKSYLIAMEIAS